MDQTKKELLDRLLKIDSKMSQMVLDLLNDNEKMSNDKWNANRLATIDNLRRANIESIIKVSLHLTSTNYQVEAKETKQN